LTRLAAPPRISVKGDDGVDPEAGWRQWQPLDDAVPAQAQLIFRAALTAIRRCAARIPA
jgi:hypothetical protein